MTTSDEEVLALLSNNQTNIDDISEIERLLKESIGFASSLANSSELIFKTALLEVVLRSIETYLLTDKELLKISEYWDSVYPRADELIEDRIRKLTGVQPSDELVKYCRNCLGSYAARAGRTGGSYDTVPNFIRLLEDIKEKWDTVEVRCRICGFHFREQDISPWKKDLIDERHFVLAKYLHPKRQTDTIKSTIVKQTPLTRLEIDHIVPREGLGWDSVDNLRITCRFCNNGKLAFRRALEPLSTVIAGAFCCFPDGREHTILRQVSAVSAIQSAGGKCSSCSRDIRDRELTVIPQNIDDESRMWFVPWNVQVLCYECIN
jgi:5-methylcytosine-specific restriction endonuclease McrA